MSHDTTSRRVFGVTHRTIVRRILATFDRANPADLEAGSRWYDEARETATRMVWLARERGDSHVELEHCAAVIAHLSPRTFWSQNVAYANTLVLAHAPAVGVFSASFDRAWEAYNDDDPLATLNGPKTRRFALNICGDVEAVTVDVWACRAAGLDELKLGRAGAYDAIEHAYRLAARRRGVDPSTMQATTWIVARNGRAR